MTEEFEEKSFEMEPEVKRALCDNKAPGCDGIPIELIKNTGEERINVITELSLKIWMTGKWPTDWKTSVFIPIPKTGDIRDCSNHKTIALILHTSKVLLNIIHNRMESHVNREMPEVQGGFRKKRGTRDHIANMRWIIERQLEFKQGAYFCFTDYSEAFDCVDHSVLWITCPQKYGYPRASDLSIGTHIQQANGYSKDRMWRY